jgi:hypothetical protein
VQEVARAADHVIVELPPLATVLGLEVTMTAGASEFTETVADWVAWPFGPLQVSE